jgi:dTMP kinase
MPLPGVLISFEGGEGCGKSTHARKLANELRGDGYEVLLTREPGGTKLGERIRAILLQSEESLTVLEEFLLFSAARAQLVRTVLLPALAAGQIVILDRFYHSSFAYQGAGGLELEMMRRLTASVVGECEPDAVLLLDIEPAAGLERCAKAGGGKCAPGDRFENRTLEFHRRVREIFLDEARRDARFTVVSSEGEFGEAHRLVREAALRAIRAKGLKRG